MKIRTANIDLQTGMTDISVTEVHKYTAPVTKTHLAGNRKYESKERILYSPFLENVLYENEIRHEPKTDQDIKIEFLKKYPIYGLKKRFKQYKESIGTIRTRYNKQDLYSAQKPVILTSFCYNDEGRIVTNAVSYYQYLSFRECHAKCIEYKIADPRFIPYEQIYDIRSRINSGDEEWLQWRVPTDKQIEEIQRIIGIDSIYDSIRFLPHLTRQATM